MCSKVKCRSAPQLYLSVSNTGTRNYKSRDDSCLQPLEGSNCEQQEHISFIIRSAVPKTNFTRQVCTLSRLVILLPPTSTSKGSKVKVYNVECIPRVGIKLLKFQPNYRKLAILNVNKNFCKVHSVIMEFGHHQELPLKTVTFYSFCFCPFHISPSSFFGLLEPICVHLLITSRSFADQ